MARPRTRATTVPSMDRPVPSAWALVAVADGSRTVTVVVHAVSPQPIVHRVAMDADGGPPTWDWEHGTTERVGVTASGTVYASVIFPEFELSCVGIISTQDGAAELIGILNHEHARPVTSISAADLDGDGVDEVIVSSRANASHSSARATDIYWSSH